MPPDLRASESFHRATPEDRLGRSAGARPARQRTPVTSGCSSRCCRGSALALRQERACATRLQTRSHPPDSGSVATGRALRMSRFSRDVSQGRRNERRRSPLGHGVRPPGCVGAAKARGEVANPKQDGQRRKPCGPRSDCRVLLHAARRDLDVALGHRQLGYVRCAFDRLASDPGDQLHEPIDHAREDRRALRAVREAHRHL